MNDRAAGKARTRQALLAAALDLVGEHGFGGLGLREVARAAGVVPGAFYRHFRTLDELGLALVEESFEALHIVLRDVRAGGAEPTDLVRRSLEVLAQRVDQSPAHLRFIARERSGGSAVLRQAIRQEIRLFTTELAVDLARMPYVDRWTTDDINLLADLIVSLMVETVEELLDVPPGRPDVRAAVLARVERQVRMLLVGVVAWRS